MGGGKTVLDMKTRSLDKTEERNSSEVLMEDDTWVRGPNLPDRNVSMEYHFNHYVSNFFKLSPV